MVKKMREVDAVCKYFLAVLISSFLLLIFPSFSLALSFLPLSGPMRSPGNWFQMVSAQERLTRTFTRSSHTYTRTERTEISKTRAGETKREVRVEESTQLGGDPFRDVFGGFMGPFSGIQSRQPEGVCGWGGGAQLP